MSNFWLGLWPRRAAGFGAIAGAVLGIALTPLMASVWAYDDDKPWAEAPRLERSVGPEFESWGLLDFGSGDLPYETYGKPFVLVYLLIVPAMRCVWARPGRRRAPLPFEVWSWRVVFGSLVAAAVGDFIAYWGASLPGVLGDAVSVPGFGIEFLAMPVLLFSSVGYGIALIWSREMPRWIGGMLIATPAVAIATTVLVTDYVPNALVVPVSLIWGIVGVWLAVTSGGASTSDESEPRVSVAMGAS